MKHLCINKEKMRLNTNLILNENIVFELKFCLSNSSTTDFINGVYLFV